MKINLPSSFEDVTLGQYQDWHKGKGVSAFVEDVNALSKNAFDASNLHLNQVMSEEVEKFFYTLELDEPYGIVNDWDKFTTGEWVDVETYSEDLIGNAHKLMAILYRPIVNQTATSYEIVPYMGVKSPDKFKDVPASYFLGAIGFFLRTRQRLLMTSAQSLEGVMKEMTSRKDGGGMTLLTRLRVAFWKWIRFLNSLLRNYLLTWRTFKTKTGWRK